MRAWTNSELSYPGNLLDEAALYASSFPDQHPAAGAAKDFSWSYVSRFDLNQLKEPLAYWLELHEDAVEEARSSRKPETLDWHSIYWAYPQKYPVILVQGCDGCYYPWHGESRISYSCSMNVTRIPAIVGILR